MTPTNDALNRWIAEFLEPKPTIKPNRIRELPDGITAWWFDWTVEDWKPVDFCADAECTVMLMEKLPPNSAIDITHNCETLAIRVKNDAVYTVVIDVLSRDGLHRVEYKAHGQTLGRATALAFARANGYREEG